MTTTPATVAAPAVDADDDGRHHVPRRLVALATAILFALSLAVDPGGGLSSDVGGKTAAWERLVADGTWDLGYAFADLDPDGRFHPFANTVHTADGQWVNTTSATMILAGAPLWAIGGARAAAVLPLAGAIVAALAAAALERRAVGGRGERSFLVVALASPATVYALDLWEHSWGLALLAWAAVAAWDARTGGDRPFRSALVSGLLIGVAATMRQEAYVYGLGIGLLAVSAGSWSQRLRRGAALAGGTLVVVAAYSGLEILLFGEPLRLARSTATAAAGGAGTGRSTMAATTLFGTVATEDVASALVGLWMLVPLAWIGWADPDRAGRVRAVVLAVVPAVALWLVTGFGFVPGLVPATPLAAVGLGVVVRRRPWPFVLTALVPLVPLLLTQHTAGAAPQWAGRYLLTTGLVLTVAAVAHALPRSFDPAAFAPVLAAALVTTFGLVWVVQRTGDLAADITVLTEATEGEVVVFTDPHKARETGPAMLDRPWASAVGADARAELAERFASAGVERFVLVQDAAADAYPVTGFEPAGELGELPFLGDRLVLYEASG